MNIFEMSKCLFLALKFTGSISTKGKKMFTLLH